MLFLGILILNEITVVIDSNRKISNNRWDAAKICYCIVWCRVSIYVPDVSGCEFVDSFWSAAGAFSLPWKCRNASTALLDFKCGLSSHREEKFRTKVGLRKAFLQMKGAQMRKSFFSCTISPEIKDKKCQSNTF
jgi:hypothetical protein